MNRKPQYSGESSSALPPLSQQADRSDHPGKSRPEQQHPVPVKRQSCQEHFWAAIKQTLGSGGTPLNYYDY